MAQALVAVRGTGKHPEEAAAILFHALADGALLGRAEFIEVYYPEGMETYRDHVLPGGILRLGPLPPLGHSFWREGAIELGPVELGEGALVHIRGEAFPFPGGGILPRHVVRGLKVWRDGVLAICRRQEKPTRGRQRGVGGYAKDDEPLHHEMRELIEAGTAGSVHAAAVMVAHKAKGSSEFASKVRRLVDGYRRRFPDLT